MLGFWEADHSTIVGGAMRDRFNSIVPHKIARGAKYLAPDLRR